MQKYAERSIDYSQQNQSLMQAAGFHFNRFESLSAKDVSILVYPENIFS